MSLLHIVWSGRWIILMENLGSMLALLYSRGCVCQVETELAMGLCLPGGLTFGEVRVFPRCGGAVWRY